jgi:hypothetical protein
LPASSGRRYGVELVELGGRQIIGHEFTSSASRVLVRKLRNAASHFPADDGLTKFGTRADLAESPGHRLAQNLSRVTATKNSGSKGVAGHDQQPRRAH